MPKRSLALSLLSLFAPPDRATEIEGDLIEQSRSRGRGWLVFHVMLTTLVLFRASVMKNVVYVVLLSYGTYELTAKVFFWGIRPLQLFLLYELDLSSSLARLLIYLLASLTGLFIGAGLVRFLPRLGAQVAIGTIGFVFLRLAVIQEGFSVAQVVLYGAVPILVGTFLANWWLLGRSMRPERYV